jgi:hypothetical protein
MRLIDIVGVALVVTLLSGCQDRPARIVDPTDASRAALHEVVSTALNRTDVTLAGDALTHSSLLTIEPKVHRDAQGNRVMGRDMSTPVQFRLVKHDAQCLLILQSSGAKWPLPNTTCEEE